MGYEILAAAAGIKEKKPLNKAPLNAMRGILIPPRGRRKGRGPPPSLSLRLFSAFFAQRELPLPLLISNTRRPCCKERKREPREKPKGCKVGRGRWMSMHYGGGHGGSEIEIPRHPSHFSRVLRRQFRYLAPTFVERENFAESGSHSHFDHPIRLPMQSLTPKPQNGQMLRFQVVTLVFYPSSDESVVDSLPLYSAGANCGLLTTATAIRPNETVVRPD